MHINTPMGSGNDMIPPNNTQPEIQRLVCIYYILYMMTSSNGNILRVTGHLCREFTGPGESPT